MCIDTASLEFEELGVAGRLVASGRGRELTLTGQSLTCCGKEMLLGVDRSYNIDTASLEFEVLGVARRLVTRGRESELTLTGWSLKCWGNGTFL